MPDRHDLRMSRERGYHKGMGFQDQRRRICFLIMVARVSKSGSRFRSEVFRCVTEKNPV